jgi:FkbM family methyltransferase
MVGTRIYEKLLSMVIGSPLQWPAEQLRAMRHAYRERRHPGLGEFLKEGPRTRALMREFVHDGVNCIDVGAHLGMMVNDIVRLSPSGRHVAFEPVPYKARWLRNKFPGVEVVAGAASDVGGKVRFELATHASAVSALRPPVNQPPTTAIEVECHRLDDFILPEHRIGFIKMDVIGAELSVIRGAAALIARDRPVILFECTSEGLATFNVDPTELYAHLTETVGYDVYSLKGWALREAPLTLQRFLAAQVYPFEAFNFVGMPRRAGTAARPARGRRKVDDSVDSRPMAA